MVGDSSTRQAVAEGTWSFRHASTSARRFLGEQRWSLAAFALVGLSLLGKLMLTRMLVLGFFGSERALIADGALIAVLLGLVWLIPWPRTRIAALWIVALVVSFVLLATAVYAAYFGRLWTPGLLVLAGQAGEVANSIRDLLDPVHAWYVADLPLLAALSWLVFRRVPADAAATQAALGKQASGSAEPLGTRRLTAGRVALVSLAVVLLGFAAVWTFSAHTAIAEFDSQHEQSLARQYGLFAFQAASLFADQAGPSPEVASIPIRDRAAVSSAIERVLGEDGDRRTSAVPFGAAEGRNVIIVQFEALQPLVIDREADGVEITPNVNALARESWYFPNTVGQTGIGNTVDAEFIFNTSLYAPEAGAASMQYHRKEIPGLPRELVGNGIDTYTFHTNDVEFWNRDALYPALGYTAYYDKQFFGDQDVISFGASDEVLYAKTLEELLRFREEGEQFCAQIITMTSHHPFDPLPDRKDPFVPGGVYADTFTGRYISNINYADRAFGEFVDELKRTGLYDDSVLIVFGDHFGLREAYPEGKEGEATSELLGRPYTDVDLVMVPMFVHLPGQQNGTTVDDVVGEVDIMPTVTDLLGIDTGDLPQFGRSVFVTSYTPPLYPIIKPLPVGSYMDADTLVIAGAEEGMAEAVPLSDPERTSKAPAADVDRIADVEFLLELSDTYVRALPDR